MLKHCIAAAGAGSLMSAGVRSGAEGCPNSAISASIR
jgi:hypothetical protein